MGLINGLTNLLFGGGSNAVRDTVDVFRENAEARAIRSAGIQEQAMAEFGAEFARPNSGWFDRFMDDTNRGAGAIKVTAAWGPVMKFVAPIAVAFVVLTGLGLIG